jgi:cysteine synthase A
VPGQVSGDDLAQVEVAAQRLTTERSAFRADQFRRDGNWRAHYRTTGPEIWRQSGGHLHGFVDFAGSGGTYAGVARYLKDQNADIRCYAVEPATAAVLAGGNISNPNHPIQGGGYAMPDLAFMADAPVDGYLSVTSDAARAETRALAQEEGIFAGFSSGANLSAALQLLRGDMAGRTIAILICDSGLKYLSTDLWD